MPLIVAAIVTGPGGTSKMKYVPAAWANSVLTSNTLARQALRATRRGGTIVLGVNADLGELSFFDNKRVIGSVIGNRMQMREVLRIAAAGKVRALCEAFPLEEAAATLRRLKRGEIRARAVLVA